MATELYGSESRLLRSKPLKRWYYGLFNGASEEVRTLDIHLGKVVLYQLSYARVSMKWCVPKMRRVNIDLRISRKSVCPLAMLADC